MGPAAGVAGQGEAGGENPGSFFQALDAQELGAERLLDLRAATGPEEAPQRPQDVSQRDLSLLPWRGSRRGLLIA